MIAGLPYAALLALTVAVEGAVVTGIALVGRGKSHRPGWQSVLAASVALNLLTHPLAFLAITHLGLPFAAVEVGVVLVEAVGYRIALGVGLARAALLALAANLATIALSYL